MTAKAIVDWFADLYAELGLVGWLLIPLRPPNLRDQRSPSDPPGGWVDPRCPRTCRSSVPDDHPAIHRGRCRRPKAGGVAI